MPNSDGRCVNLLSRRDKTPSWTNFPEKQNVFYKFFFSPHNPKVKPISAGILRSPFRSKLRLLSRTRLPIEVGSSHKKFSVIINSCRFSHFPIFPFNTDSLFWSTLSIVSLERFPIPFGKWSTTFCDKCKSVRLMSPPTSSGKSSSRFSDRSKHVSFLSSPISDGTCWSWLWSSQSSCSAGNLPMCGGWKRIKGKSACCLVSGAERRVDRKIMHRGNDWFCN